MSQMITRRPIRLEAGITNAIAAANSPSLDYFDGRAQHAPPLEAPHIRKLYNEGYTHQAINSGLELYHSRCKEFGKRQPLTVRALADVLEYASGCDAHLPELIPIIEDLEKFWTPIPSSGPYPTSYQPTESPGENFEEWMKARSHLGILLATMYALPRVCMYAAKHADKEPRLHQLAQDKLQHLQRVYELCPQRTTTQQVITGDAASSMILTAATLATMKRHAGNDDLQLCHKAASFGREMLTKLSPTRADYAYALFEARCGLLVKSVERLEKLLQQNEAADTDTTIASLDLLTACYINLGYRDEARRAALRLQETLRYAGSKTSSSVHALSCLQNRLSHYLTTLLPTR